MGIGAGALGAGVAAAVSGQGQGQGQGQSATPPGQAPTSPGAGFYGGPLPPGFSQVGYGPPGTFTTSYGGFDQRYPGRTLAEKIFLYQQRFGTDPATGKGPSRAASIAAAASPISQGIGSLSPGPTTAASTFQAIISLANSRGLNPDKYLSTPDASTFLADAQQLATSDGIPIQQAIISLAASRGLDPNEYLNMASVGIGSIAPTSTDPTITGGFVPDKNQILDAITASGVLPVT